MDALRLVVEVEIRCVSVWEAQGVPEPAFSLPMATMTEPASMAQPTVLWPPLLRFSVTLLFKGHIGHIGQSEAQHEFSQQPRRKFLCLRSIQFLF